MSTYTVSREDLEAANETIKQLKEENERLVKRISNLEKFLPDFILELMAAESEVRNGQT